MDPSWGTADGLRAAGIAPGALEALAQLETGGRVLSRFERVVNVEAKGGRLLAVHTEAVAPAPFSLVLASAAAPDWPDPGAPSRRDGQRLLVGDLSVDLRGAAALPEPGSHGSVDRSHLAMARATLAGLAAESALGAWWEPGADPTDDFAGRLRARARSALTSLVDAARHAGADQAVREAAVLLLGLGPGGTPSGDDALVGFLGAWLRLRPGEPTAAGLAGELAVRAPAATTRLAAEFLYHLARGRLSLRLELLLAAIAGGDREAVAAAGRALASYGATSGRDTILGIHAFLSVDGGQPPGVSRSHALPADY